MVLAAVKAVCGGTRPFFPGKRYLDWELPDPTGQSVATVRPIPDDIRKRIEELIGEPLPH